MNQTEQMEALRALVDQPLDPELVPYVMDTPLGPRVKHPLVFGTTSFPGTLNAQLKGKKEQLEKAANEKRWFSWMWLHERPYRIRAVWELVQLGNITTEELRDLWIDAWMDTEFPNQFGALPRKLFAKTGFVTDSQDDWDKLQVPFMVYRGSSRKPNANAISWTTDPDKARWFARRFSKKNQPSKVWTGQVTDKSKVLGYFKDRGENEVVIEPRFLTNITGERKVY